MALLSDAEVGLGGPGLLSDADVGIGAQPQTSPIQRLAIDYANQQEAAGQRTTPIISAQAPNYLGQATEDEFGNLGYKDINGQFVPTDRNQHITLVDPADNMRKVYARTEKTGEGLLSSAGRMLGTMFGPGNIQVSKAAPAAVQAAERLGTNVPRAIASEQPLTQFAGQLMVKAPGGGPLQEAIPASVEQLGGKVQEAADLAGGTASRAAAGEGFREAMGTSFEPATSGLLDQAYGNVQKLIDVNKTQPLNNTTNMVGTIGAERYAASLEGPGKAADLVLDGINRREGLTFEGIKRLRNTVGKLIKGGELAKQGYDEGEMNRIYGALSDDLRTLVIDSGGPRAAIAYQRAEGMTRGIKDWTEQLRKVLGPNTRAGEGVYDAISRMAKTGAGADQNALVAARAAVPREVWQDVASTTISNLGKNANGQFSPALFIRDYSQLSDVGKRALFAGTGSANLVPFLNDIATVSDKFVQAGKLANYSGSGGHIAAYTAINSVIGGVTAAVATGSVAPLLGPVIAIGGILGNNMMARVLATPATAASMARWARAYQTIAERPTPAGLSALSRVSGEFANTVNGAFGTKLTPQQILRSTVQGPGTSEAGTNQENIPRPPGQ